MIVIQLLNHISWKNKLNQEPINESDNSSMLSAIADVKDFFRTRQSICKSEHEHRCALIGYYQ